MSSERDREALVVLHHAAVLGRTDVLSEALMTLKTNGTVEYRKVISTGREEDGATPLHLAAHHDHKDVVRALLTAGADMCARDMEGKTPYLGAAQGCRSVFHVFMLENVAMGQAEKVAELLRSGVPVDARNEQDASTALHWAISFEQLPITAMLLQYGADPNALNASLHSPLHVACKTPSSASLAIIEMLLQEASNPALLDKDNNLPADLVDYQSSKNEQIASEMLALLLSPPSSPTRPLHKLHVQREEECKRREAAALAAAGATVVEAHAVIQDASIREEEVETSSEEEDELSRCRILMREQESKWKRACENVVSENQYLRQLVVRYLNCKEPMLKRNIETALLATISKSEDIEREARQNMDKITQELRQYEAAQSKLTSNKRRDRVGTRTQATPPASSLTPKRSSTGSVVSTTPAPSLLSLYPHHFY